MASFKKTLMALEQQSKTNWAYEIGDNRLTQSTLSINIYACPSRPTLACVGHGNLY